MPTGVRMPVASMSILALIGMVHVLALPGSPGARQSLAEITKTAVQEARILKDAGFDAILLENMHDRPYINAPHPPHTTSAITKVAVAVREAVGDLTMGIQVLSRGEHEAQQRERRAFGACAPGHAVRVVDRSRSPCPRNQRATRGLARGVAVRTHWGLTPDIGV